MKKSALARKAELIDLMLKEVAEHYHRWNEPMPMRFVAARYGRALGSVDSFPKTIQELEQDGSIIIEHFRTGKRLVYPALAVQIQTKKALD